MVLFAALTASAGWIMVKSGLVNRPWVNAYKLTLHFVLALVSVTFMVKTIADVYNYKDNSKKKNGILLPILILVTFIQMVFAGLMAGMKAGLYYPSWPDMNGYFLPEVLQKLDNWKWINLTNYDTFTFAPALVQFTHRILAYLLVFLTLYIFSKYRNNIRKISKFWLSSITALIFVQLLLGILTVLNIKPGIPLLYGVLHQFVGLLFFIGLFFLIARTTQTMGAAVTTVAMKLGYIFPIIIAFTIYNESATLVKLTGTNCLLIWYGSSSSAGKRPTRR